MFCTGCGTALAASERFCPQCGRPNPAAGAARQAGAPSQPTPVPPAFQSATPVPPTFQQQAPGSQPPFAHQGAPNLPQAAAQARNLAGQAEQVAGRAGQFLQGAQAKLANQSIVQQAAAKLDQINVPGLQTGGGAQSRDFIWSAVTLLVTLLGIWRAPLLLMLLTILVAAAAILLGMRAGVSPVARAVAFTLAGGLVAFSFPADPIQLTAIALSGRGAWGIVKELFPAEGPRIQGSRAKLLWGGMAIAAIGLCFQWTKRESSYYVTFSPLTRWNYYGSGTNLEALGTKMNSHYSYWGGENAAQYIIFLIGLALLLYFTQGKRWSFGWQVGLMLLVWPLLLAWMQGLSSYLGIGLLIYTIGIAVALRGLLGERMPWPKQLK